MHTFNRRSLVALSTVGAASVAIGAGSTTAQSDKVEKWVQNASFIRDLSGEGVASPAASPGASPAAGLNLDDLRGYILGPRDVPNTLKIFADYRCPHCRDFHKNIEPSLWEDFVMGGRLNLEIFDFTVIGVPDFESLGDDTIESVQAAEAAACAAEQDHYLVYREWLYEGDLVTDDGDFSDGNLIGAAEELGLDADLFSESLLNGVYEEGIIAMVAHGIEHGVQGTPTLMLNDGEPFFLPEGGYDQLKEDLEAQLQ